MKREANILSLIREAIQCPALERAATNFLYLLPGHQVVSGTDTDQVTTTAYDPVTEHDPALPQEENDRPAR
jgi:hypothetical protein